MTDTAAPSLRRLDLATASEADRRALTDRASTATPDIRAKARAIVDAIREGGDAALREANARFGGGLTEPAEAPALAEVPFPSDEHGYTIRYHKGGLMLDAFRRHLGDEDFLSACRRFYEKIEGRSVGTDDFRAHWQAALDDDDLLTAWLDSPGRAPLSPAE